MQNKDIYLYKLPSWPQPKPGSRDEFYEWHRIMGIYSITCLTVHTLLCVTSFKAKAPNMVSDRFFSNFERTHRLPPNQRNFALIMVSVTSLFLSHSLLLTENLIGMQYTLSPHISPVFAFRTVMQDVQENIPGISPCCFGRTALTGRSLMDLTF